MLIDRRRHRRLRFRQVRLALTFYIFLKIAPVAVFSQGFYSVTDLGTLGGEISTAYAINNSGTVVGVARMTPSDSSTDFPFVYSKGVMRAFTLYPGSATGINSSGQITGFTYLPVGNPHGFLFENDILSDIGALKGSSNAPAYSLAYGINGAGVIVGQTRNEAMIYFQGEMFTFSRRAALYAYGINDSNDIAGILESNHAFIFQNNRLLDIGTLDRDKNGVSAAYAINSSGQVVGYSFMAGNSTQHAFLYQSSVMRDLGTLRGGYSIAWGINAAGDVVGESDGSAFLYHNGVMIDLNTLVQPGTNLFRLEMATAINDLGQIVGRGFFLSPSGERAFLLTPLP
jgi:probable HAF family extracellular repeat protein